MRKLISKNVMNERVKKLLAVKKKLRETTDINDLHVRLQKGNTKTGMNCWTVSLLPVIDCVNCAECRYDCYDLKNDMIYKQVVNDRCRNSLIHQKDIERFWSEINLQIKANFVMQLRINVGGDLIYDDFKFVSRIGKDNPKVKILFFTKNYEGINKYLEENEFPENVHPILSVWCGTEMSNPHNLPEAHVLYEDGTTTAPEFGAYYCGGNCSECAFNDEGCWTLKKNEHVIFKAH